MGLDGEGSAIWLLAAWLLSTLAVLCALACLLLAVRVINARWKRWRR
jgi:hypothetical protein